MLPILLFIGLWIGSGFLSIYLIGVHDRIQGSYSPGPLFLLILAGFLGTLVASYIVIDAYIEKNKIKSPLVKIYELGNHDKKK